MVAGPVLFDSNHGPSVASAIVPQVRRPGAGAGGHWATAYNTKAYNTKAHNTKA